MLELAASQPWQRTRAGGGQLTIDEGENSLGAQKPGRGHTRTPPGQRPLSGHFPQPRALTYAQLDAASSLAFVQRPELGSVKEGGQEGLK